MVAESSKMSLDTSQDLTDVMWSDPQWLSSFPLNEATALHYFTTSPFYDPTCNNQLINAQQLDPSLLKTMAGTEYSVASPCPALFIVTKSRRSLTPPSIEPLATYYIHEGNVYQAPTLHAVLSTRMLQALHHMRKALDTIQNAAALTTTRKYTWDPPPGPPDDTQLHENLDVSMSERKAVDDMLYDILQKNADIRKGLMDKEKEQQEAIQQQQGDQNQQKQEPSAPEGTMQAQPGVTGAPVVGAPPPFHQ